MKKVKTDNTALSFTKKYRNRPNIICQHCGRRTTAIRPHLLKCPKVSSKEKWRPIPTEDWGNWYSVSTWGGIYRHKEFIFNRRHYKKKIIRIKKMHPTIGPFIKLRHPFGHVKYWAIRNIIADTFLRPRFNGMIYFKDKDPRNCILDNLAERCVRYATKKHFVTLQEYEEILNRCHIGESTSVIAADYRITDREVRHLRNLTRRRDLYIIAKQNHPEWNFEKWPDDDNLQ